MKTKRRKSNCPECNSENVAGIVFGYPAPEMMEQSERGEIVLGGCCVGADDPEWHCIDCGHEWCLPPVS